MLRPLRDQGLPRPGLERAVRPGIGLGTTGPLARTTLDAAAYLDIVSGYEWGDPFPAAPPERPFAEEIGVDPGRLRIALTTEAPIETEVDAACIAAAREAAELLASLGHQVEEAAPDWGGEELMEDFLPVWQAVPALYPIADTTELSPLNQWYLEGAFATTSPVYAGAIGRLQLRARRITAFWADYDLLLTPTLAMPPVPVGWDTEPDDPREQFDRAARFTPFTAAFNVTGQPAVVAPAALDGRGSPDRRPARRSPLGEALLFRVSSQLESARPWASLRPPHSNIAAASVLCDDRHMDTPPLPSGTVTFVFTDIESSTDLVRRLGTGFGSSPGGASQCASVRLWRNTTDTRSIRPATGSSPHSSEPGTPLPRRLPRSAHSMHPSASRRPCVCAWAFIPRSLS